MKKKVVIDIVKKLRKGNKMFIYVPTCDAEEVINMMSEHPWHDGQYCPSAAIFAEFIRQGDLYANFESAIDFLHYDDCNLPELIEKIAGDEKFIAKMMGKLSEYEDFVYRPADETLDSHSGFWGDIWDFGNGHYKCVVHCIHIAEDAPLISFYGFGDVELFHRVTVENLPKNQMGELETIKKIAVRLINDYKENQQG